MRPSSLESILVGILLQFIFGHSEKSRTELGLARGYLRAFLRS